ncbi:MarR family winged helix-turn-helix transcriptional regulator [Flagellimonas allohymeniacidonis]|uniref:MarR family transcriptional regulator n=1 Tax=Flagellimonas allohymeniacidonis TaxID=2517819 RepID=A0A4Q8QKV4_9FLAO|nr:MarR family winged helix-turn-helix transcriptional regulator [Allomuricauda hymeniacidonis]TAI49433.1 MarR family transcriptional regulator [Allomuricauda hymeniacidonis]
MKYKFQDCIGSRLRSASRKIDAIYRQHLSHSGVTANQLSIMMALYKTGETEQNEIARFLNLEKSSLSRNLVRLLDSNYVKKHGPVNRPIISLTKQGKRKVDDLAPHWEKAMDKIHKVLNVQVLNAFQQFEESITEL